MNLIKKTKKKKKGNPFNLEKNTTILGAFLVILAGIMLFSGRVSVLVTTIVGVVGVALVFCGSGYTMPFYICSAKMAAEVGYYTFEYFFKPKKTWLRF